VDGRPAESRPDPEPAVIIGAGPAGLTAALELVRRGISPLLLEKSDRVGGIARTVEHQGYRLDIGGHRFFTKVPEVDRLWREVLGEEFLRVPRLSRILFRGRLYDYPLVPRNALANLGPIESLRILLSYLKWKVLPYREEATFEQYVTNRFGRRLYERFFKTYTEKVWGIPCDRIRADWAAQRIRGLSLMSAVVDALTGRGDARTLIKAFDYPRLGPGLMWERFRDRVERGGGRVELGTEILRIEREGRRIRAVVARRDGRTRTVAGERFLSSMPLDELVGRLSPPPPAEVCEAARGLAYRDFLIVGLFLAKPDLFPDNWLYVHTPGVRVGRIQNFGNWSAAMVPGPGVTSLGMEYFCSRGDDLWEQPDADLIALAGRELDTLGLADPSDIRGGVVVRQEKAYPVYDGAYRRNVAIIRDYLGTIENLQTMGRNGLHRYNNQDHSMLTALLAVRNLLGERHDLWEVNTERSYHEDFEADAEARPAGAGAGGIPCESR
jgi:protoporphyrinogen oxidase